jgi:hypothetical protein
MKAAVRIPTDIERLVTWALRDQGLGWEKPGKSAGGYGFAQLGTLVSGGVVANPNAGLLSDEDALLVKMAVDMLAPDPRAAVLQFGRAGLRPEGWDEAIGEPQQLVDKRGRPRWDYDNPNNKRGPRRPLLDMLAWSVHRDEVLFARRQWTMWREALLVLRDYVGPKLQHHIATGPEAPAEPWLTAAPVIHGAAMHQAPELPQPWLRYDKGESQPARTQAVEQLRTAADADVKAVARDWGAPTRPIRRRRPRARTAQAVEN